MWYQAVLASMVVSIVIGPVLAVASFSTAMLAFWKSKATLGRSGHSG